MHRRFFDKTSHNFGIILAKSWQNLGKILAKSWHSASRQDRQLSHFYRKAGVAPTVSASVPINRSRSQGEMSDRLCPSPILGS
jgi:hypothetical protein